MPTCGASAFSTLVSDNTASNADAIVHVDGGELACEKTGTEPAGFLRNTALASGVALTVSSTMTSQLCDWGTGADDNGPVDIVAGGLPFSYGDGASFNCDTTSGCY